jgi:hypothetical protein
MAISASREQRVRVKRGARKESSEVERAGLG